MEAFGNQGQIYSSFKNELINIYKGKRGFYGFYISWLLSGSFAVSSIFGAYLPSAACCWMI
jgi:hypothetical protein